MTTAKGRYANTNLPNGAKGNPYLILSPKKYEKEEKRQLISKGSQERRREKCP